MSAILAISIVGIVTPKMEVMDKKSHLWKKKLQSEQWIIFIIPMTK